MKIQAAIVYKPHDPFVIEEVDLAEPKANEVLVKVVASGYCHTDYSVAHREVRSMHPVVLGHEGSGIIESVGSQVTGFKPGDRVCMSFCYCGECYACVTGRPYQCEQNGRLNFGGRAFDGTARLSKDGVELANFFNQSSFATYAVTHVNNLVLVPEEMDLRLTGPLGCGIQTGAGAVLNCLKPEPGSSIVVFGCGGVGMSGLMAAKASGCTTIIAVDTVDSRLALAMELGATHTINAKNEDPEARAKEITKGFGTNYALDATGSGVTARAALRCTHYFGMLAIIGGGGEILINAGGDLGARTVTGITEGRSIPTIFIPTLMNLHLNGLFPFDKMVQFYDFADINKAEEDSISGKTIKPILLMPE
ncbi:MAG: NAD(P)-dependent alcohol dehydrogenase [Clostridiales bacterium]|nr:NAD(P)-dependent alcohol dehydrogenase [Clostridiales bacterium]